MTKTVIVKSLEEMEAIVGRNHTLYWDGWTVVRRKHSVYGASPASLYVEFIDGEWCSVERYTPEYDGWSIPKSIK